MIIIPEKKKWDIAGCIAPILAVQEGYWKTLAKHADLNVPIMKIIHEPFFQTCLSIVEEANKQHKLLTFLQFVVKAEFSEEQEFDPKKIDSARRNLLDLLSELQNGYKDKLDNLAKVIHDEKCILFLGPDILRVRNKDGIISFNKALCDKIQAELHNSSTYFDEEQNENLAYLVHRYYKIPGTIPGQAGKEAADLFKKMDTDEERVDKSAFEKLVKIPWKLIINTNPDDIMANMINAAQKDSCLKREYSFANNSGDKAQGLDTSNDINEIKNTKKSFFYNLFGTFDAPQDILYTESDFLDFITNVEAKTPPMHQYIDNMFGDTDIHYLFLGFDFDQWYFKIFARTLKLHKANSRALSLKIGPKEFNESNLDFFEQTFKFYFVNDEVDKFLIQLIKSYEALIKK